MSEQVTIYIDGREVKTGEDRTVMEAAGEAGIYIPRLCFHPDLTPAGHCRVCTVRINGKLTNSCSHPVSDGMVVENDTAELLAERRRIIEMLFVEGNHNCPYCEASGNCELQALGYRFGMLTPTLPYMWPEREVDASHPDVFIDRNRCILCGRCVRASRELDKKSVFGFQWRGTEKRITVNARGPLSETQMAAADRAATICPTGSLVIKRIGYARPFGTRDYDIKPIGSEIEK